MKKYDYVLRNCRKDMTSFGGFVWPKKGPIEAPDWNDRAECGGGLHGWLNGEGDISLGYSDDPESIWLVVQIAKGAYIDLLGKIKFRKGNVIFSGTRDDAVREMQKYGYDRCMYGTATAGDMGTATAGDMGTATAGDMGTATAGDMGTATAGDRGTATAGDMGTATAGDMGVISIMYFDTISKEFRRRVAMCGENGIDPGVKYRLNSENNFEVVRDNLCL